MRRRLFVVTVLIVVVLAVVLAIVGGNAAAKPVSVAEALSMEPGVKIQVTGNVVKNSFSIEDNALEFHIYDSATDPTATQSLDVRYDGGVSDTFGNDVVAICTGKKNDAGTLVCSELVTKCPSKYENSTDAISVSQLLGYGDAVIDTPVKVSGVLEPGSIGDVSQKQRFVIVDEGGNERLAVVFEGALPDGMSDGAGLVITGSLDAGGKFRASNVALEE